VNPVDTKIRANGGALAPSLPAILGMDVAGVVEAVGAGVTGFAVGDAVYGCAGGLLALPGAYAEKIVVDARLMAKAPSRIPLRDAAALPLVAITAYEGLFDRARLQAGQRVLVHGGAGGVGHVAIQLAKARGAFVATTVSTDDKAELVRSLGADEVIRYREEAIPKDAYDVVFDTTGGDNYAASFEAAAPGGQVIVIVARHSVDVSPMHLKGLSLHVVFMLLPMIRDVGRAHHGDILREVAGLVDQGRLRPVIDPNGFDLATVGAAHAHLASGKAVGKVVIDVG